MSFYKCKRQLFQSNGENGMPIERQETTGVFSLLRIDNLSYITFPQEIGSV